MMMEKNYLPEQYAADDKLEIAHNYLQAQFADHDVILEKIKKVVIKGDFTLGETVNEFEKKIRELLNVRHAITVGNGTEALFLALKSLSIGPGDEVITTPFTFIATIGAIVASGATPVFVDIGDDYNINVENIEKKITSKTKAILPVHWAGKICEMHAIKRIAEKHDLKIVEDACHAIQGEYHGKNAGTFGDIGCFSFHPLKNLNVWGDGGVLVTQSDRLAEKLSLLRNHGLKNRNECVGFGYNSRLDTIQAVVGLHLIEKLSHITDSRIRHAHYLDDALSKIKSITVPKRDQHIKQVYHLYSICCENRDALQAHLIQNGVDAKVHYPIPMHLQPAAKYLGYQLGDFPKAEWVAAHTLSLPVHEFITEKQMNKMIGLIQEFYA